MTSTVSFRTITASGENDCGICLCKSQNNENIIGHGYGPHPTQQHEFHRTCIIPWFEQTNICPLCKNIVSNAEKFVPLLKKLQRYNRKIFLLLKYSLRTFTNKIALVRIKTGIYSGLQECFFNTFFPLMLL